jgi:hypothetical protein
MGYLAVMLSVTVDLSAIGCPVQWSDDEGCAMPRLYLLNTILQGIHATLFLVECVGARIACRGAPMEKRRRKPLNALVYIHCTVSAVEFAATISLLIFTFSDDNDEENLAVACQYSDASADTLGTLTAVAGRLQVLAIFHAVVGCCFLCCAGLAYQHGDSIFGGEYDNRIRTKVKRCRCLCFGGYKMEDRCASPGRLSASTTYVFNTRSSQVQGVGGSAL